MSNNTIKSIVNAQEIDMGGFPVRQAFPNAKIGEVDPFLLLHHANVAVPDYKPLIQSGVGPHPHRGFSPVTFIFKGGVHHRDSRGNDNTIYAGGTQWMHAGMGIVHSERPPENIFEIGGRQEIIQLWVNSPAKNKMDQPAYYPLSAEETPEIISSDSLVNIHIISGEINGVKGAIPTLSPVNTATVEMQKGGRYIFEIAGNFNTFLYLLDGKIDIAGHGPINANYAVIFNADGDKIEIEALDNTRLLFCSGAALNEPVARHGPFVMNTQTEILEAFRDYEMGKMGVLIES